MKFSTSVFSDFFFFPVDKTKNIYGNENVILHLISVQTSFSVCIRFEC